MPVVCIRGIKRIKSPMGPGQLQGCHSHCRRLPQPRTYRNLQSEPSSMADQPATACTCSRGDVDDAARMGPPLRLCFPLAGLPHVGGCCLGHTPFCASWHVYSTWPALVVPLLSEQLLRPAGRVHREVMCGRCDMQLPNGRSGRRCVVWPSVQQCSKSKHTWIMRKGAVRWMSSIAAHCLGLVRCIMPSHVYPACR